MQRNQRVSLASMSPGHGPWDAANYLQLSQLTANVGVIMAIGNSIFLVLDCNLIIVIAEVISHLHHCIILQSKGQPIVEIQ